MKRTKLLMALLLAALCAFATMGLVACGGGGGGDASGDAQKQEAPAPEPTDEELITADIEKTIGTNVSSDAIVEGLKNDETISQFTKMGFDLEGFAKNIANKISVKVGSVDVTGDTAVAHVDISVPDFSSEEANKLMSEKAEELTSKMDITKMDSDELGKAFGDLMNGLLSETDFPVSTTTVDVDYVKDNGTWKAKDDAEIEAMFGNIMGTSSK